MPKFVLHVCKVYEVMIQSGIDLELSEIRLYVTLLK